MNEEINRFKAARGEQYVVEGLIGRGGMAEVYRALDVRHGRPVAVKILDPTLSHAVATDRFVREIEIAARLQHPNILPVYDSGNAGGTLYYIMPFVEGGSLRDRLRRDPHPSMDDVVRIIQEVADALAYAHQRNVVHRDIKPENILFSADHAVVADFGIARAIEAGEGQNVTLVGFGLGTPEYMSPEQAFGEADIDGRSDTYSLACVAFELFTGEPPFAGGNATAVIMRKTTMDAPRLTPHSGGSLPAAVDAVVSRGLMRNRDARQATVQEFARALREAASGARTETIARTSQPRERLVQSIAVLPFVNASGAAEDDFLCDGISDELVHALGKVPGLRVVARTSSFAFKGSTDDARTIAQKLRVSSLLEGTLRRSGNRLRMTTQLVDATTGFQLWSERFDRQMTDVFEVQDEITRSIVSSLKLELMPDEQPQRANPVAYERYLEARFHWNRRTETGMNRSLRLLDEVITLDEEYAPAHAAQSSALVTLAIYGQRAPADVMPKARAAADRAIELSPALAEALTARACVRAMYEWDWEGAEQDFVRALESDPQASTALQWYAMNLLVPQGRFDEARTYIKRARAADPVSPVVSLGWGLIHYFERDFERAVTAYRELLERSPDFEIAHFFLGQAMLDAHRPDEAFSHLQRAMAQAGAAPETMAMIGVAHATAGRHEEAQASLAGLMERAATAWVSPVLLAQLHSALGSHGEALDALERAAGARATDLVWIGVRPAFDAVRLDPRFESIVRQVGLQARVSATGVR